MNKVTIFKYSIRFGDGGFFVLFMEGKETINCLILIIINDYNIEYSMFRPMEEEGKPGADPGCPFWGGVVIK